MKDCSLFLIWLLTITLSIDCWDGHHNEPIIYHGWTLTSKLDFKEVLIDAVKPYAFFASEFPLVLSIENHCSKKQQDRMAEHMKNILGKEFDIFAYEEKSFGFSMHQFVSSFSGDMLYTKDVDRDRSLLPSPNELKGKILIKAKKIRKISPTNQLNQHFECPEPTVSAGTC